MSEKPIVNDPLIRQEEAKVLVTLVGHPIVEHALSILRDKNTDTETFRRYAGLITRFLAFAATKDLKLRARETETPLETTTTFVLADDIVLVPVLRAGLSMMPEMIEILPQAKIGFIGLERDEETAIPKSYYVKLPPLNKETEVIILDPMLATGGSANEAINLLEARGAKKIRVANAIAAPEGILLLRRDHPDVPIFTCAVDRQLNEKFYILPGVGDWGDRVHGTV